MEREEKTWRRIFWLEMELLFEENTEAGQKLHNMLFQGQNKLFSFKNICRTGLCGHLSIQWCPTGLAEVLLIVSFFPAPVAHRFDASSTLKLDFFAVPPVASLLNTYDKK